MRIILPAVILPPGCKNTKEDAKRFLSLARGAVHSYAGDTAASFYWLPKAPDTLTGFGQNLMLMNVCVLILIRKVKHTNRQQELLFVSDLARQLDRSDSRSEILFLSRLYNTTQLQRRCGRYERGFVAMKASSSGGSSKPWKTSLEDQKEERSYYGS